MALSQGSRLPSIATLQLFSESNTTSSAVGLRQEGEQAVALTSTQVPDVESVDAHEQAQPQSGAHGHLPDAGLVMGQSCRVGWGPGGVFACASKSLEFSGLGSVWGLDYGLNTALSLPQVMSIALDRLDKCWGQLVRCGELAL